MNYELFKTKIGLCLSLTGALLTWIDSISNFENEIHALTLLFAFLSAAVGFIIVIYNLRSKIITYEINKINLAKAQKEEGLDDIKDEMKKPKKISIWKRLLKKRLN